MTPANPINATPESPPIQGILSQKDHEDHDLELERQCHGILINDGGRPWYPIELLGEVSRNPEGYDEMLSFWQCKARDWVVFARQLKRWLDFRDWQRRNREGAGLPRYGEAMGQRLSAHKFTGTFQLKEDLRRQDRLTTWVEYLNYECWWHDRDADNVKCWRQQYNDAWEKLVDSIVLRPSDSKETILSEECAARRASEEETAEKAVELANSASRSRLDTATESLGLTKRRNDLISEFTRATQNYQVAETNAERHNILLRWVLAQASLIEAELDGRKSTDDAPGGQNSVHDGGSETSEAASSVSNVL